MRTSQPKKTTQLLSDRKNDESVPASFINNELGFSSVKIFKSLQLFFFQSPKCIIIIFITMDICYLSLIFTTENSKLFSSDFMSEITCESHQEYVYLRQLEHIYSMRVDLLEFSDFSKLVCINDFSLKPLYFRQYHKFLLPESSTRYQP